MNFFSSKYLFSNLLCALLALLPLSLLSGSLIINIFTILISIIFIFEIVSKKKLNFLNNWSFYLLLFLWASFLINLIFSQDSSLGILRSVGFIRFVFFIQAIKYLFLHENINYKNIVLKTWMLFFLVVSFDLLLEYFSGQNILGYKSNLQGRLAGFLGNELKIGGYYFGFAPIFIATIYLYFSKESNLIIPLLIAVLVISFLIGERSNFIKIFILLILILITFFNKNKIMLVSSLFACFLLFFAIIYKNENLRYRYILQWNKSNISENIYFVHYKTAILVFQKYPIFGSGIKNFRIEIRKIINKDFKEDKTYNNWQVITTHPHQINFEFLAETGLFGYLCFLIFFILSFKKSIGKFIESKDFLLLTSTIFCLVYINPILPSGSFFTTFGATIFWTNYAIMISFNKSKKINL